MNLNLHGKKNIAFFGCSFTSGHELIDHEFLGITFDDCNKLKEQFLKSKKGPGDFDTYIQKITRMTYEQFVQSSSKRSYGAKLARKLNLNHLNFAEPGLSVEHSTLKFFDAVYSGRLKPETDVIFFGLTTPHRYLYFDRRGTPFTRVMSHENFHDEDIYHNDYKIMQSYFFAIQNCINFCLKHSFEFIVQPVVHKSLLLVGSTAPQYEMYLQMDRNWKYLHIFKKMLDEFMQYSIDDNLALQTGYRPDVHGVCAFKHPPEIAHEIFSESLYDRIVAQQN